MSSCAASTVCQASSCSDRRFIPCRAGVSPWKNLSAHTRRAGAAVRCNRQANAFRDRCKAVWGQPLDLCPLWTETGAERQGSDLNSGDATTIFASCGSSGNSAIVLPTCRRAEEHGGPLELCGGGVETHTIGAVDTGAGGGGGGGYSCLERVTPRAIPAMSQRGETLLLSAPQRSVQKARPVQESKRGRGCGGAMVGQAVHTSVMLPLSSRAPR